MGLAANDVPFILRIIVQSLVPGSPTYLSEEASNLLAKLKEAMPASPDAFNLHEKCPACNAEMELRDIITAVCTTGHIWRMHFPPFQDIDLTSNQHDVPSLLLCSRRQWFKRVLDALARPCCHLHRDQSQLKHSLGFQKAVAVGSSMSFWKLLGVVLIVAIDSSGFYELVYVTSL